MLQQCCGLVTKLVAYDAYWRAIPSLDLILTPNGFDIVSNENIAPASKERIERLMTSLEAQRDSVAENLLLHLSVYEEWRQTAQGKYFSVTMFPFLGMCRRLAIREHIWESYQQLREKLIKIEPVLAETYFSQEQMQVFRLKVLTQKRNCSPIEEQLIRTLQSLELMLVSEMQVHPQSFYDLVTTICEYPEVFPEWHASKVAELYTPIVFKNKKTSSAYWF